MDSVTCYLEKKDFDNLLLISEKYNVSCSCILNYCFCKFLDQLLSGITDSELLILHMQSLCDTLHHYH